MTSGVPGAKSLDVRLDELRDDLVAATAASGCEILEARFEGRALRIVLDHPDGVTLSHCEEVSKRISALLDVVDFGAAKYVLEISSPGLDRKLYGAGDFERFAGRRVRVTWTDPQRGKRTDVGRLDPPTAGPSGPRIGLGLDRGEPLAIDLDVISEARLEIEL